LFFLAACVSLQAFAGSCVTDSLYSNVLKSTVKCRVYIPDGFKENTDRKYPVVYLLHGLWGTYKDWNQYCQLVADELIESGELKPSVIVMPNAGDPDVKNIQNGYFNVKDWAYEDFFFQEFLPWVEAKYRVIGDKPNRAIMGLSMGGGGSAVYCQRHPDMFSSCYAMSAWLDNSTSEINFDELEDNCLTRVSLSVHEHAASAFVRNADAATIERLKTVKWFIDCGDDDFLLKYNVDFHFAMNEAGIKNELRVRNGVHNWEYWHEALRLALPFASRNFD